MDTPKTTPQEQGIVTEQSSKAKRTRKHKPDLDSSVECKLGDPTKKQMSAIYTMKGVQDLLEVLDDRVMITPKGILGFKQRHQGYERDSILVNCRCSVQR